MKRFIAQNEIQFYTIDGAGIAQQLGLGGRINMDMQSAFFKLASINPLDEAVRYLKEAVVNDYGNQGQKVIDMNYAAIEKGIESAVKINVPAAWKTAPDKQADIQKIACACSSTNVAEDLTGFVKNLMVPMNRQEGDSLPVSAFKGLEDGTFPMGTSAYEKRGIALNVPEWQIDNCIQCNQCAYVCPHAAIRPILVTEAEMQAAPAGFTAKPAVGAKELKFRIAVAPLDCIGCGNCAQVCPAKEKALVMKPFESQQNQAPLGIMQCRCRPRLTR